jgi:hypothetical protein
MAERPARDPEQGGGDDPDHRPREAVEDAGDPGDIAVDREDPRERDHQRERREQEEHPRGEGAGGAIQEPPHVDRQLVRLGAGEQHREVQRVEVAALVDPPAPFDQLGVHE